MQPYRASGPCLSRGRRSPWCPSQAAAVGWDAGARGSDQRELGPGCGWKKVKRKGRLGGGGRGGRARPAPPAVSAGGWGRPGARGAGRLAAPWEVQGRGQARRPQQGGCLPPLVARLVRWRRWRRRSKSSTSSPPRRSTPRRACLPGAARGRRRAGRRRGGGDKKRAAPRPHAAGSSLEGVSAALADPRMGPRRALGRVFVL